MAVREWPRLDADLHADLTKLAVMWLLRALLNLHQFWKLVVQADRYFRHQRPDAVILIDYPGFNWWIARRAKIHGIPVFYYGAPQMWAWAAWRVHKMRRLVDHVLCKLPFEADWFRAASSATRRTSATLISTKCSNSSWIGPSSPTTANSIRVRWSRSCLDREPRK